MSNEFLTFPRYKKEHKYWLRFLIVMIVAAVLYLTVSIVALCFSASELDGILVESAEILAALASIAVSLAASIYGAKSNKKLRDYLKDIERKNQPIKDKLKPYTPKKEKPTTVLKYTMYAVQGIIIALFFSISVLKIWNMVLPLGEIGYVLSILSIISTLSVILLSTLSIWSAARFNYNTAILIQEIAHQDDCLFELYNNPIE